MPRAENGVLKNRRQGLVAVILAGGHGGSLLLDGQYVPRVLLPLGGKPLLEHQLSWLAAQGVHSAILSLGRQAEGVRARFGDGSGFGLKLRYSVEQSPLGTAGAVKLLEPLITGTFIVLNGDIVTDMDLSAEVRLHQERRATGTLFLVPVEDPSRFGVVELDKSQRVLAFTEKPKREEALANTINGGCYILEPEVFGYMPKGEHYMFERGLFPGLLAAGRPLYGYVPQCYWNDVGTPATYLGVHYDILAGKVKLPLPTKQADAGIASTAVLDGPVVFGKGCKVGANARIEGPSVLGDGCVVGDKAVVSRSVLWDGVQLGAECRVRESALGRRVEVGNGASVEGAIVGDDAVIREGGNVTSGTSVAVGVRA